MGFNPLSASFCRSRLTLTLWSTSRHPTCWLEPGWVISTAVSSSMVPNRWSTQPHVDTDLNYFFLTFLLQIYSQPFSTLYPDITVVITWQMCLLGLNSISIRFSEEKGAQRGSSYYVLLKYISLSRSVLCRWDRWCLAVFLPLCNTLCLCADWDPLWWVSKQAPGHVRTTVGRNQT